jgi:hypothetical protein
VYIVIKAKHPSRCSFTFNETKKRKNSLNACENSTPLLCFCKNTVLRVPIADDGRRVYFLFQPHAIRGNIFRPFPNESELTNDFDGAITRNNKVITLFIILVGGFQTRRFVIRECAKRTLNTGSHRQHLGSRVDVSELKRREDDMVWPALTYWRERGKAEATFWKFSYPLNQVRMSFLRILFVLANLQSLKIVKIRTLVAVFFHQTTISHLDVRLFTLARQPSKILPLSTYSSNFSTLTNQIPKLPKKRMDMNRSPDPFGKRVLTTLSLTSGWTVWEGTKVKCKTKIVLMLPREEV